MNNLESVFTNIYKNDGWHMGQNETKSGLGSTLMYTENIRNTLIEFINKESIQNMLDTSCGDWHWMKLIQKQLCNYTGIDIVKEIISENNKKFSDDKTNFINNDFLTFIQNQPSNSFDLIFCRHTLEHLPTEYNINFINECKRVCKYLFVTGYNVHNRNNTEVTSSHYRPINLKLHPYSSILEPFYYTEFYDGPSNVHLDEMYMYVYKF
jgi:ubiquinone/menaquinone biosynthesis C-methylase UbiE